MLIVLFALVANRSILAMSNCFVMKENVSFKSINSILSLNSLDFFCLFSIILARYMGSQDPVSLHFSPFLDLFCYFMASSGPNMIYVGKFSCTVTCNFNMFTQEISLKQLKVNKNSQSRLLICEENFEF